MSFYPEDDEVYFDNLPEDFDKEEQRGLSLIAKLVILVLVLALLVTLVWPLFRYGARRYQPPTPTPILLEARRLPSK